LIGERLPHHEVVQRLGEGGMGVVYKARDKHLDRFVAIKVLPPERLADPGRTARFVQEALPGNRRRPWVWVAASVEKACGHIEPLWATA
jgi:serine/threonine protein kinase